MRTTLSILFLTILQHVYGQTDRLEPKGKFQLNVAFNLLPVQRENATLDFSYIDGTASSTFVPDTITAKYNLESQYFNHSITLGIGYYVSDKLKLSLGIKPHLNSFLSNRGKNKKVYGVQFDFGADFLARLNDKISLSYGTSVSKIIGGFGITSRGPTNKEFLWVSGNELYDDDIGFHIIDNSWGLHPRVGVTCLLTKNSTLFSNLGYQISFSRKSRLNFAGTLEDGTVKWNRKSYDDSDIQLMVNDTQIKNSNIEELPFKFSGFLLELGISITLNRSNTNKNHERKEFTGFKVRDSVKGQEWH